MKVFSLAKYHLFLTSFLYCALSKTERVSSMSLLCVKQNYCRYNHVGSNASPELETSCLVTARTPNLPEIPYMSEEKRERQQWH